MEFEAEKALPEILTTKEAATVLRRRPNTLRQWACQHRGPLKPVKLYNRLGWRKDEILALLEGAA